MAGRKMKGKLALVLAGLLIIRVFPPFAPSISDALGFKDE
jgi:hypothetical protein